MTQQKGDSPLISFILVNYRTPDLTIACVRSIQRFSTTYPVEIVIADNASGDDSVERLRSELSGIVLVEEKRNWGFGAGCNAAARAAGGDFFYLLNTDTLLLEDSAAILADFLAAKPQAVAVGSRLQYPDGTRQISACNFPTYLSLLAGRDAFVDVLHRFLPSAARHFMACPPEDLLREPLRVDWCVGASLLVRADAYRRVNGFDEDFFMYADEMDLCLRLSRLGEIWYTPATSILHFEGGSDGMDMNASRVARIVAGQRLYYQKHFPRPKAALYLWTWRLTSYAKYCFWRIASAVTGKPEHKNKVRWHELFLRHFNDLRYPLPR